MKRSDDYPSRREHLAGLSDGELHERFWALAKELTDPLLRMGREYTSPSIERSVLLRMGFSSVEAMALGKLCLEHGLLGHGAGHVVYRMGLHWSLPVREAGLKLLSQEAWDEAGELFRGGKG